MSNPNEEVSKDYFEPCILTKALGHPEIHNSKYWKVYDECYLCDKWRYTYIFWNPATGQKHQIMNMEDMFTNLIFK